MELEFRTTADDYLTFYKYYFFQRKLVLRVACRGLICLAIGNIFNDNQSPLRWTFILAVLWVEDAIIGI